MVNEFQIAMHTSGIVCKDPIIADGQLHRFANNGRGDRNGWYVFHEHGGAYGDWGLGIHESWSLNKTGLSPEEKRRLNEQIEKARLKYDEERKKCHEEVAREANHLWSKLSPTGASPYLDRKKIATYGARFGKDSIVIPLYDSEGKLWSLQEIYHNGDKRFFSKGRKKGCFYAIGSVSESEIIFICEGFSTAASIHEATQIPTVVAFDAGNLDPVTSALKRKFPDKQITLCADNDQWKEKNIGIEAAKAVAAKYNCKVVWPEFSEAVKEKKPTDFNDLFVLQGIEEVKDQINKVLRTRTKIILPPGFTQSNKGLYFSPQDGEPIWVCSPLEVLAYTRDEFNENWGRLIRFKDLDGHTHILAIPMESLKGDCTDFYGLLLCRGLRITPQKRGRLKLPEYIQNIKLDKFATCTTRIGWYENRFICLMGQFLLQMKFICKVRTPILQAFVAKEHLKNGKNISPFIAKGIAA